MALDIAPDFWSFIFFCFLEIIFIILPMIIFKLQKKDLKYEFKHRIVPEKKSFCIRIFHIFIGLVVGVGFYFIGGYLAAFIRSIVIEDKGVEYYEEATEGSVNTTPPPPSPVDFNRIYFELIFGIVVMFLLVAFSEEFCFRGVIFKELNHKSKVLGYLLSSFMFMIYHVFPGIVPWETFLTFWLYYFSFGILLAGITHWQKGDLIIAIVAHGAFNSILWVLRYLQYF
jgi:membrane protease YdiL (CAAX protease family)